MVFIDFSGFEPPKIRPKSMLKRIQKKTSKKNFQKIDFGFHFASPKPPKIDSKATKISPKSDVKRSSFCDAMETTRGSSEVNGGHSL